MLRAPIWIILQLSGLLAQRYRNSLPLLLDNSHFGSNIPAMDTQSAQSEQNIDYYVPANNLDFAMMQEPSTQSTEITQRDLCLEDYIGCGETVSLWDLPHTGPYTQSQYGGESSRSHELWIMDPTLDNPYPAENIPDNQVCTSAGASGETFFRAENIPQHDAPTNSTYPLRATVDSHTSQMWPGLPEIFEQPSSSDTFSTPLGAATTSSQQPANTVTSHARMMPSQNTNHQLDSYLHHNDIASYSAVATPYDQRKAQVFQLAGPTDMVPVINCLPNGVLSIFWKKF
ncbi:hypothetical protein B0O99DRAFT_158033 [Bisporella sp. PMI_857]|nr:hypothetical protein B0O99DRAFT_158033 [Bisporella sp. PMI_857]